MLFAIVVGWSAQVAAQTSAPTRIAYEQCVADLDNWAYACGTYLLVDGTVIAVPAGFEPKWSPDGGRIALLVGDDMVVIALSDQSFTNLTNHPAGYQSVAWSPDATRIAFASDRDGPLHLYVMDADGSNLRRLTSMEGFTGSFAWSPDGTRIAFSRSSGASTELDIVNSDGSSTVGPVAYPGSGGGLSWSFDGSQIAFMCPVGLCAVKLADGTTTQLTTEADFDPVYSPSDNRIAFKTLRFGGDTEVAVLNLDGSVTRVAPETPGVRPVWSPGGTSLVFGGTAIVGYTGRCYFGGGAHNADDFCVPETGVFTVNADGTGLQMIAFGDSPDWFKPMPGRPVSSFTAVCNGTACDFDGRRSYEQNGTIRTYSWDFGDGTSETGPTVNHIYPAGATYPVTLTVSDESGHTDALRENITANASPIASFTFSCSGATCTFDGRGSSDSDGSIASYYWYFGDGNSSQGPVATHLYPNGAFTATLFVFDNVGASGMTQRTLDVVNSLPIVSYTRTCSGLTCTFDASASYDPDGSLYLVTWLFGDVSAIGYGAKVTHTYSTAGTYTLTLLVRDNAYQGVPREETFTVVNAPPVASFNVACVAGICNFDASSAYDPDGTISTYAWSFGDGSSGSGRIVSHVYAVPGPYDVTLAVTDRLGAPGTLTRRLTLSRQMHVGDLDGTAELSSHGWTARVTISVHDFAHQPVPVSATVTGSWGPGGPISCAITNGQCTVSTAMPRGATSVTFTVKSVTQDLLIYDATANHDPDGDSNGTSITVKRPQ